MLVPGLPDVDCDDSRGCIQVCVCVCWLCVTRMYRSAGLTGLQYLLLWSKSMLDFLRKSGFEHDPDDYICECGLPTTVSSSHDAQLAQDHKKLFDQDKDAVLKEPPQRDASLLETPLWKENGPEFLVPSWRQTQAS